LCRFTPARIATLVVPLFGSASATAELVPGTNAQALVDGQIGPTAAVWRSPAGFTTADLHLRVQHTAPAGPLLFAHSRTAPPDTWAKVIEVWVALRFDALDGDEAIRVGQWTLAQTTDPQAFPIPSARLAGAWLQILSNYGSAEYTSFAEFALLPPAA
jgi:hypothetical protein